jgi:general secretion pathway protein K
MKKGSILIIVLWVLFFLGILALAVRSSIWPQLDMAKRFKNRAQMYYLAKAGVRRAIAEIRSDETEDYDALNDNWSNNEEAFKNIELGNGIFSVEYALDNGESRYGLIDEERKININSASLGVLVNLFTIVGRVTSSQALEIASSIIDWRDEDEEPLEDGAESGYYITLKPPYICKNAEFGVLEELLFVKGMTEDIFYKVKEKITVYGEGAVNINTADSLVLRSLGMDSGLADKIMKFRKGEDGKEATEDDNVFENIATLGNALSSKVGINIDELDQLDRLRDQGLPTVNSNFFFGKSRASTPNKKYAMYINFVFDRREKVVKYWKEE